MKGYTLIEMLIVIILIGILSVQVIPRYQERISLGELQSEKKFTYIIWEGLETYAKYQKELTGVDSWPEHPLTVLGRTRGVIVTASLGIPNQDDEWRFDGTKLYHRRRNNEIWYFIYNPTTFSLSELPVKL